MLRRETLIQLTRPIRSEREGQFAELSARIAGRVSLRSAGCSGTSARLTETQTNWPTDDCLTAMFVCVSQCAGQMFASISDNLLADNITRRVHRQRKKESSHRDRCNNSITNL